jgi:tetratricopeptide (TPR) repeat protein
MHDGNDRTERIHGVFSTEMQMPIGFGSTKRYVKQNVHVFATEEEDGRVAVQALNPNFVPSGPTHVHPREEFLKNHLPEPSLYMNKVRPMMQQLEESVQRGDTHRAKGELVSAEFEYKGALRLDEEHVRATFGLGLTYLERGEKNSADVVFRRLVTLDGAFESEHKHLFNEFGIRLRKNGMLDQALKYYSRAFQLAKNDENLFYNMSRIFYEKGNLRQCRRFVEKALRLNPDFDAAKNLQAVLDRREQGPAKPRKGKGKAAGRKPKVRARIKATAQERGIAGEPPPPPDLSDDEDDGEPMEVLDDFKPIL